ncbi:unnamed protein product [Orchesella dallaii]|uniref:Transmembrane protein n=1 Tax=Orchesella dallaii TaxID=48710 RepID=A0ABP1PSQ6_9HEXA
MAGFKTNLLILVVVLLCIQQLTTFVGLLDNVFSIISTGIPVIIAGVFNFITTIISLLVSAVLQLGLLISSTVLNALLFFVTVLGNLFAFAVIAALVVLTISCLSRVIPGLPNSGSFEATFSYSGGAGNQQSWRSRGIRWNGT